MHKSNSEIRTLTFLETRPIWTEVDLRLLSESKCTSTDSGQYISSVRRGSHHISH